MTIVLYTGNIASPPARTVETVAKIAGINLECRNIDITKGENTEPWFLKLNPTRQIPVLDDNGYILTDSHAIATYLLDVHAPKDISENLYPSDPKKRGIINSALHFESGVLFARIKTIFLPLLLWGEKETPVEKIQWLAEAADFLDKMLEGKKWLAGDHLTVADISVTTTVDLVEVVFPITHFKNLSEWATRVRATCPFYKEVSEERVSKLHEGMATYISGAADRWNLVKNKYLH